MTVRAPREDTARLPRSFRLTIIRHGQTAANLDGKFCGTSDLSLTSIGRKMAQLLPTNPHILSVKRIVSSPLLRARETADAMVSALGLEPLETDFRLRELEFGQWEGMLPSEVDGTEAYRRWSEDPYHNAPPDGETGHTVLKRTLNAVGEALFHTQNLAVVTHKTPARLLAAFLARHNLSGFRSMSGFAVSSVTVIQVV
ncbi:MAG: histidine phosphatase family protein, partial [Geminicoccaceae bacterium]